MSRLCWGNWTLNQEDGYLEHENGYEISLSSCRTPAQLLDWIFQVRPKNWVDPSEMYNLLEAIDEIIAPQSRLCSNGRPKELTSEQMQELVDNVEHRREALANFSALFPPAYRLDDQDESEKNGSIE